MIGGDALAGRPQAGPGAISPRCWTPWPVPPSRASWSATAGTTCWPPAGSGVPCVLVSFGYTAVPARELGADAVIDRLDQLPAVLALHTDKDEGRSVAAEA